MHARSRNEDAAAIDSFFDVEQRSFPILVSSLSCDLRRGADKMSKQSKMKKKKPKRSIWNGSISETHKLRQVLLPLIPGAAYAGVELRKAPSPLQKKRSLGDVSESIDVTRADRAGLKRIAVLVLLAARVSLLFLINLAV